MEKAKPIAENVRADLAVSDVLRFFREHPEKELKPTYPPLRPKGGEVYIFYPEDDTRKGKLTSLGDRLYGASKQILVRFSYLPITI